MTIRSLCHVAGSDHSGAGCSPGHPSRSFCLSHVAYGGCVQSMPPFFGWGSLSSACQALLIRSQGIHSRTGLEHPGPLACGFHEAHDGITMAGFVAGPALCGSSCLISGHAFWLAFLDNHRPESFASFALAEVA